MSESNPSYHKQLEAAYRTYYGADSDPLRFVPAVSDKDVAHEVAEVVNRGVNAISEEDIAQSALRAQARYHRPEDADPEKLRQEALNDRFRRIVVNSEITHARLAPGDFNEDSVKAGADEMGAGRVIAPPPEDIR